ncbi:hypothetical protein TWF730_009214 [Orbilia blumenaviensis]|uniref:F-box domain-containing protein n=1 Tax=Orbilia blumenaviensis TaxID=1796055 RepID=A0AAV9UXN8_9PEZI
MADRTASSILVRQRVELQTSSLPEKALIEIMNLLEIHDLCSFATANKSAREALKRCPEQIIVASLARSLPNPDILKWFPFPETHANSKATAHVTFDPNSNTAEESNRSLSTQPFDAARHLLYLRHAIRVLKVSDGISFFSKWLHRVERHGNNGNHNCSTEYCNSKICNETFRVVLFLAQNEVYNAHRYLRHCTVEERIAARCDPQAFDKIELPLPENWWIRESILTIHRDRLREISAEGSHRNELLEKYLDYVVTTSRDESFQHRRMWLAKYLTRETNMTPARKIEEFEKQGDVFWYNKGIVTGLVFTQIAPLSWWHDSMIMGAWQSKDRDIRGFEHMRDVSISCYQKAVKVVEILGIKD